MENQLSIFSLDVWKFLISRNIKNQGEQTTYFFLIWGNFRTREALHSYLYIFVNIGFSLFLLQRGPAYDSKFQVGEGVGLLWLDIST